MLLGDDSDSEVKITINKNYAERYNTWRQKEELQKLKDRYGEEAIKDNYGSSGDSSSSDDEDENAEQLTQQLEKNFFKTLSCLKKKDPRIYDKNTYFFNESVTTHNQTKSVKKEERPLFLRDYERKLIVEREGKLSEDEDEDDKSGRPSSPTIAEEEKIIKDNLKRALKDSDDEDGNGDDKAWGGIFQKRVKTEEEEEREEEDYREWLKGQKEELTDKRTESDLKFLHDYWNDPGLNDNDKFLKDYLLNKRFLEENDDDDDDEYIPTYEEIVHDSDENLSEDEKTIEKQEEFEHKFNFRFEEPDKEFIKRYPRTMENSLRKKDERRKRKRQEVKERKAVEEAKKREEIKRLKSLKRKEIMEKIEKLKEITGNEDVGFKDEDLEGDFDPDEYDKRMNQLFNQEFYGEEETAKPEFPELDEELEMENWDSWNGESYEQNNQEEYGQGEEHEPHCEDPGFNMDCDYDPAKELQNELIESTKRKKKGRKWKSVFAQAVSQKKPVFDSKSHTFDEYLDEYYKLDFEDLIGDLPCRFKYRKVVPNNFGLSVDEILKADDKELNKWCSLKKAVQHRPEHVEKYDVHAYQKKAKNEELKKKIFLSVYNEKPVEEQEDTENEKQKKKKKSKKHKHSPEEEETESDTTGSSKKKEEIEEPVDADNEQLVEDAKKQLKRKHKRQNKVDDIGELHSSFSKRRKMMENDEEDSNIQSDNSATKHKKKNKKQKIDLIESINGDISSGVSKYEKGKTIDSDTELIIGQENGKETGHENSLQNSQHDQSSNKEKKKRKKKKNKKLKAGNALTPNIGTHGVSPKSNKHKIVKKFSDKQNRKVHGKRSQADQNGLSISDARLRAYGINPKKYKNKIKYGNR